MFLKLTIAGSTAKRPGTGDGLKRMASREGEAGKVYLRGDRDD
jgi:hypothetical protein